MQRVEVHELLDRAQRHHQGGDLDAAEALYNAILSKNIASTGAPWILYLLGTLQMERGNNGLAAVLLGEATRALPTFGEAFNNLGIALAREYCDEAADQAYARASELLPAVADIPCNRAGLYVNEGQPSKVMALAGWALEIDADHALARWHMALGMLEAGMLTRRAWDYHEARLVPGITKTEIRRYHGETETPWWRGEAGRTVVVHGEQGIGDEIMFASCLPDAIGRVGAERLVFECAPRLATLFARSFPCRVVGTNTVDGSDLPSNFKPDCKIAVGSLPWRFRDGRKSFPGTPYLAADPAKVAAARARLPEGRLRVGVSWQGGHHKTRVDLRSFGEPDPLLPILGCDADFVSLQYTMAADDQVKRFESRHGIKIHHWPDVLRAQDYDETAALVASCDLLISVCQSVIHLAGALGKPCWVLVPSRPAWRYGIEGDRMPWYGETVRLFRQKGDDWASLIERVAGELADHVRVSRAEPKAA